jgi:hypothetical protein
VCGAETGTLWKIDLKYLEIFLNMEVEHDGEYQ